MVKAGNRSFNYDYNGNLLTESLGSVDTTYKYNVSNRVVDVFTSTGKFNGTEADPQNRGVEYTYDVLGRRSSRLEYTGQNTKNYLVESNKTTMYDGFGINPLADFVDNSMIYGDTSYYAGMKPKTEFVRGNGQVLTTGDFGTTTSTPRMRNREYLHHDVLGSTMMVTSRSGSLTSRYSYDAFGNAYEGNFVGGNNKLGYNGKEFDPVAGIYNYGYRDYSARLARFTTVDPIRDGSNWYAYCNNDPVNFIDPLGLCDESTNDVSFEDKLKLLGEYGNPYLRGGPQLTSNTPSLFPLYKMDEPYVDTMRFGTLGAMLTPLADETVGNLRVSKFPSIFSGVLSAGNVTLYVWRNRQKDIVGYEVTTVFEMTTPPEFENAYIEGPINSTFEEKKMETKEHADHILETFAPHLVDQALGQDTRGWFERFIDWLF